MANPPDNVSMALFCDFENVALGVRDAKYDKFDIRKVLERLLLKGSIVVKKAYCDWDRYREFKAPMHEASFELIEIPHVRQSGKNSADIRMVVDALDLCYTKSHVDTFVIISGDSDFSPLVSKLRENNKTVIGVGVKGSTSDLLTANCDEFIFYDDLVREPRRRGARASGSTTSGATTSGNGSNGGNGGRGGARSQGPTAPAAPSAPMPVPMAPASAAQAPAPAPAGGATEPAASAAITPEASPAKPVRKRAPRRGKAGEPSETTETPAADEVASSAAQDTATAAQQAAAPVTPAPEAPDKSPRNEDERRQQAIDLALETVEALITERGADDKIWGSMVKQTLKRRRPGFAEGYYGYRSFNELLEDARDRGLLALEHDEKSGGYVIRLL